MGISGSDAPGGAGGSGTVCERQIFQVGEPFEARKGGDQCLPTPDHAIRTVSGPVEGKSDQLSVVQPIIHHARNDMRVMMLDSNALDIETVGILRGEVMRMQVMRNELRLYAEDVRQMLNTL